MLVLTLLACGDEDLEARLDALEAENAAQAALIANLEDEVSAINGAVDLTELDQRVQDNADAIAANAQDAADGLQANRDRMDQHALLIDDLSAEFVEFQADLDAHAASLSAHAGAISDLQADTAGVADVLQFVSSDGTHVYVTGANLYIQSGDGSTTGSVNGLGNLIVGYDEDDGGNDKSGSHNLILGPNHDYTSYSGIVSGQGNASEATYASVIGGTSSTADASYAVVVGGYAASASGSYSAIFGGWEPSASGLASTTVGGREPEATGAYATASGGRANIASGSNSAVYGGYLNEASASMSLAGGGFDNVASGYASAIRGGYRSEVSGDYAGLIGGYLDTESDTYGVGY
jgi:uncharacterized coiled-coil protein SlyX